MRTLKALVLLLPVFAIGCASSPDPQHQKILEAAPNSPESWTSLALADGEIDQRWWHNFGDEKLAALVDEALKFNDDIEAATSRVDRAIAQAKIAGAEVYPMLNAGLSGARSKSIFNFGDGVSSAHTTSYGASLSASWEIDVWGRIRSGQEAAIADVEAAQAGRFGAALSLATQVTKAYFAAVDAGARVRIYHSMVENAKTSEKSIRRKYERGTGSRVDVDLAASQRSNAEAQLAAAEAGQDAALRQLETLVGRYPSASVEIAKELPSLPQEQVPAGIPADIVRKRPDLVQAERRYAAASRRVDEAIANRYPKISLTASGGTSSDEIKDLLDGNFSVWSLAANITAPIFDGGRLKANVELNEANVKDYAAQYVRAVIGAWQEVEVALAADALLSRQAVATAESRDRSASALRNAETRYGEGESDILVVLNSRSSLYQAEASLVAIQRQRLDARVSLIAALGGGFEQSMADIEKISEATASSEDN